MILIGLILIIISVGLFKLGKRFLEMPVFGMDKDLIVINKAIAVLILIALAIGFLLLATGILDLAVKKNSTGILAISGTILFSSALIGLILFSNRLKQ